MRKLLIILTGLATIAAADSLDSFSDVQSALTKGKEIRVVVDFSKCDSTSKMQLQLIVQPNIYKIYPKVINFYIDGLALNNPSYANTPVYEHTQYVIKDNDVVEVWGSILSSDQSKILSQVDKPIVCKLGKGAKIFD